jgi:hypothetical protein
MATTANIIESIARSLIQGSHKVSRDAALPGGPVASVTASRTYFSWKGLVVLSQHVVVRQLDNATMQDVQELFAAGFRFGKRANWVPLLRGMQFGYMIIPVIVGSEPDGGLVQYVSASLRKHWSLFEYPVVVDSGKCETFHFQGTALWGAFFASEMRRVVEKYITNSLPQEAIKSPRCRNQMG